MSIQPPVFNLTASNIGYTDEELQKELSKTGGKYFDTPGTYDLTITAASFHENKDTKSIYCKGDSTWFNVKITFTAQDGKSIDHWLQVPTQTLTFGEKKILGLYRKFQAFLIGIGEVIHTAKLNAVLTKYFTDPSKLVGLKVNAELGYEGDHVAQQGSDWVIMVKGKPVEEDGVVVASPDRSSAVQTAKSMGIEPGFMRILKFTPKKVSKLAAASDW